jgi:hypothetical protein
MRTVKLSQCVKNRCEPLQGAGHFWAKLLSKGMAHIRECEPKIRIRREVPLWPQPTIKIGGFSLFMAECRTLPFGEDSEEGKEGESPIFPNSSRARVFP